MLNFQHSVRGVAFCGVLLMVGCGTLPDSGPAPVDKEPEYTDVTKQATPVQPTAPPQSPVNGATQSLIDKAGVAATRGDYEQALALLERAQRIEPDSGEIYLLLANTYQAKGDMTMARATAERGMLYCSGAGQCDALRGYINP